ncbi:uncharacterized protein LOC128392271 [Panonychus citri]|uniref:uncharacterized protein LOC128392271 n=1 Tax=Panonychus citri TaxID=50023 RepID=UPI00230812C6|nr:uncharacterized protein LOC128392271 [Panonychus citri]
MNGFSSTQGIPVAEWIKTPTRSTKAQSSLIFSLKWPRFWDYLDHQYKLTAHQDSISSNQTQRKRRNNFLLQITATLIFQIGIIITQGILFNHMLRVNIYLFIHFGQFCLTAILVDTSVNLAGLFKSISLSLKSIGSSELQLEKLRQLRQLYLLTVRATESAETFFQFLVTLHYVSNFVDLIFLALNFKSSSNQFLILWIQLVTFGVTRLIYLTLNMSSVHVNSKRAFEHLYQLSLNTNRISALEEIHKFMMRISSTNIGFTFADLLLISPNFITSLLSFSFTIGIALIDKVN